MHYTYGEDLLMHRLICLSSKGDAITNMTLILKQLPEKQKSLQIFICRLSVLGGISTSRE